MLSGYFNITSLLDVILVSTWLHFGFQNPPKSCLGDVLGRLEGVLGRLGVVLGRLGGVWGRLGSVLGACPGEVLRARKRNTYTVFSGF